MGRGVRVHFFDDQGNVNKISVAKFNELTTTSTSEHFKAYAGKRVRYALSVVEVENRKVVKITTTNYSIIQFDCDGNLDQEEFDRELSTAMSAFNSMPEIIESATQGEPNNVLDLVPRISQKIYQRDFEWKPTQEEINAIINDIFPSV